MSKADEMRKEMKNVIDQMSDEEMEQISGGWGSLIKEKVKCQICGKEMNKIQLAYHMLAAHPNDDLFK